MEYVIKTLFHSLELTPDLLRQIHHLSGGNIGIICQLAELIGENESGSVNASRVYHDVILHRLREKNNLPEKNGCINPAVGDNQ